MSPEATIEDRPAVVRFILSRHFGSCDLYVFHPALKRRAILKRPLRDVHHMSVSLTRAFSTMASFDAPSLRSVGQRLSWRLGRWVFML